MILKSFENPEHEIFKRYVRKEFLKERTMDMRARAQAGELLQGSLRLPEDFDLFLEMLEEDELT